MKHLLLAALVVVVAPAHSPHAQSFQGLGDLPGGEIYSIASAISADGAVVVGASRSASSSVFSTEAFRWTSAGGMVGLGDLRPRDFRSAARAVSEDGSVVVGTGSDGAFRWTAAGGMLGLGYLPGGTAVSYGLAVSADGSVVVGSGTSAGSGPGFFEAFRWTAAGGMVGLGDLPGNSFSSSARGISADGTSVVGEGNSENGTEAFRWTAAGGMVGLGDLPSSSRSFSSAAYATSADGSVVVGSGRLPAVSVYAEAFRWTAAGGMAGLGDLPGGRFDSYAIAVSADGAIVVGQSASASGNEAFVWTAATGMRSLRDLLTSTYSLDLTGWTLSAANGVSADGQVVVGTGINPSGQTEGWRAVLGAATTTAAATQPGATVLPVASNTPFAIGNVVTINPGGATEESGTVVGFGSLILATPLQFAHAAGETVVARFGATSGEVSATPTAAFDVSVWPNPARGAATLALALDAAQTVSVGVFDVLGREVALLHDGPLAAGTTALPLDTSALPAGVYVARATAGGAIVSRRITVVR